MDKNASTDSASQQDDLLTLISFLCLRKVYNELKSLLFLTWTMFQKEIHFSYSELYFKQPKYAAFIVKHPGFTEGPKH